MTCQSRHRTYVIGMPIAIVWRLRGFCLLAISLMAGPAAGAKEIGRNLTRDSIAPSASLPCRVTPEKPDLGFDLRFHAAYHIRLPLKELDEVGSPVKVTITVTPARTEEAAEFVRWFRIPNIPPGTTGQALLDDTIELGPGRFRVAWTMQDSGGRVCSSRWEWDAKLGRRQRDFPVTLGDGAIAKGTERTYPEDGVAGGRAANPRKVKVLLNLSPSTASHSILAPEDSEVLFSILRGLAQEPGAKYCGLVAFNIREQRIVYRADNNEGIDLASLRQALHGPESGTVNYRVLRDPSGRTDCVTRLLIGECGADAAAPDAIVIIGSKVTLAMKVPLEILRRSGTGQCPIFYINYNPDPIDDPFRDTIGSALRAYKGVMAYNIIFPDDVGAAVRDILARISAPAC